jgi:hypothetical protein
MYGGEEGLIMSYLIVCSGLTGAQHVRSVLERSFINAYVVRPPLELTEGSCGYAVELKSGQLDRAVQILRESRLTFRKVYSKDGTMYTEVKV